MKRISTIICLLIGLNGLYAQTQYSNESNISAGAGNSSLKYSIEGEGNVKSGIGGNIGFGYTHFFATYIGFSLGMEAAIYNSSFDIDAISTGFAIPTPPDLKGDLILNANYAGFNEKQSAVFVQLPIMLNFQIPLGSSAFFYVNAGGKYGFPVSSSFNQTVNSITTTGYSSYTGQTFQNLPSHGFDTYQNVKSSDKMETGSSLMFALEAGLKWKISQTNYLYTGIYLDNGVNNIFTKPTSPKELLDYNNDISTDYKYNSILQTNLTGVEEIKTFAVGVKIKIAFGSGKKYEHTKKVYMPEVKKVTEPKKVQPKQTPKPTRTVPQKPRPILDMD